MRLRRVTAVACSRRTVLQLYPPPSHVPDTPLLPIDVPPHFPYIHERSPSHVVLRRRPSAFFSLLREANSGEKYVCCLSPPLTHPRLPHTHLGATHAHSHSPPLSARHAALLRQRCTHTPPPRVRPASFAAHLTLRRVSLGLGRTLAARALGPPTRAPGLLRRAHSLGARSPSAATHAAPHTRKRASRSR